MHMKKILAIVNAFKNPLLVLLGLIIYLITDFVFKANLIAFLITLILVVFGMWGTLTESFEKLRSAQFGIDYIAILAVLTSLITRQYLVGIIIALMSSTGDTLEDYAASQAKSSLNNLADRIPQEVLIKNIDKTTTLTSIKKIKINQIILVRKGEVVPLDGILITDHNAREIFSIVDKSYLVSEGKVLLSGTVQELLNNEHARCTYFGESFQL